MAITCIVVSSMLNARGKEATTFLFLRSKSVNLFSIGGYKPRGRHGKGIFSAGGVLHLNRSIDPGQTQVSR